MWSGFLIWYVVMGKGQSLGGGCKFTDVNIIYLQNHHCCDCICLYNVSRKLIKKIKHATFLAWVGQGIQEWTK